MVPSGSSQNIIKHAEMAFRFQLPVGNEGPFVVITINQHYQCSKENNYKGAVTKQPLKFKKLLVDYMKSTNNFFVFLSKKGPEGPFSLV